MKYKNKDGISLNYTQRNNIHTDLVKEVLDEYARSNFYSDTFRSRIATLIEDRLSNKRDTKAAITKKDIKSETVKRNDTKKVSKVVKNNAGSVDALKNMASRNITKKLPTGNISRGKVDNTIQDKETNRGSKSKPGKKPSKKSGRGKDTRRGNK